MYFRDVSMQNFTHQYIQHRPVGAAGFKHCSIMIGGLELIYAPNWGIQLLE